MCVQAVLILPRLNVNNLSSNCIFFYFVVKLQFQAEERGVVSIKGISANRYLAMKDDGRLMTLVSIPCFMFNDHDCVFSCVSSKIEFRVLIRMKAVGWCTKDK